MSHIWRSSGQKLEFKGKEGFIATFCVILNFLTAHTNCIKLINVCHLDTRVTHNSTNSPVAFCFFTSESAAARFLFRVCVAANKHTTEQRLTPIIFTVFVLANSLKFPLYGRVS